MVDLDPETWLDVQAHRRPAFDGMENLTKAELWKECWRDGWWFHEYDVPDPDEATDAELAYLKGQGLTMINLYRAMGYKGKVVPQSFKARVKALASKHENTQEPSHE